MPISITTINYHHIIIGVNHINIYSKAANPNCIVIGAGRDMKSNVADDTSAGIENYVLVRELFLHPDVTDSYELKRGTLDAGKIKELLCGVHDFSEERVSKALEKILIPKLKQKSIEQYFGAFT
jgi:hypothetical protein